MDLSMKTLVRFIPRTQYLRLLLKTAVHAAAAFLLIAPGSVKAQERSLFESHLKRSQQLFLENSLDNAYQAADDALSIAVSPTLQPFYGQDTEQIRTRWERVATIFLAASIAYKADERQKAHALFRKVTDVAKLGIGYERKRVENLLVNNSNDLLSVAYTSIAESCDARKNVELYKHIETTYRLEEPLRRYLLSLSAGCYLALQLENGIAYDRLTFPDANIAPLISSVDHTLIAIVSLLYPVAPEFIPYNLTDQLFAAQIRRQARFYDVATSLDVLEKTLRQWNSETIESDKHAFTLSALTEAYGRYLLLNCFNEQSGSCEKNRQRYISLIHRIEAKSPFSGESWSKGYAYLAIARPYSCFESDASAETFKNLFHRSFSALNDLPIEQSLNPQSRLLFAFARCFENKNWKNLPTELIDIASSLRRSGIKGYSPANFTLWEPLLEYSETNDERGNIWGAAPVFDLPRSAPFYLISGFLNGLVGVPRKFDDPTPLTSVAKDPFFLDEVRAIFPPYWVPESAALRAFANYALEIGDFERAESVARSMTELLQSTETPVSRAVSLTYTTNLLLDLGNYEAGIAIFDKFGGDGRLGLPEYLLKPIKLLDVRARIFALKGDFHKATEEYLKLSLNDEATSLQFIRALELSGDKRDLSSVAQEFARVLDWLSAPRNRRYASHSGRYFLTLGLAHITARSDTAFTGNELEKHRDTYAKYSPEHSLGFAALDAAISRVYLKNGDREKARRLAARALTLLGDRSTSVYVPHPFDTVWYINPSAYTILKATETLESTGGFRLDHLRSLFRALQTFRRDLGQREVELTIARVSHQTSESLIRRYEDLQRTYETAMDSLARASVQTSSDELADLRKRAAELSSKLEKVRSKVQEEAPEYLNILREQVVDLSDIQSRLDAGELAIFIQLVNETLFVLEIRDNSVNVRHTEISGEDLGTLVKNVRHLMIEECRTQSGACVSSDSKRLAEILFGSIDLKNTKKVTIFPDMAIGSIPFAALWLDGKYLVERFSHVIAPSPSAFYFARANHSETAAYMKNFFGLADPTFNAGRNLAARSTIGVDAIFRAGRGGVTPINLSELSGLPETYTEASGVAEAFNRDGSVVIRGENARERTVRSYTLSDFDVLLFATHGIMAHQLIDHDEPGLALTPPAIITDAADDGFLSASEAASLKLDADWVILSACNTARDSIGLGDGLSQLSRAFMYAGARTLLVTHWEVESDLTSHLIRSAVKIQREVDNGLAEALRTAIVNEIQASPSLYSNPGAWAPYFIVSAH